MIEIKDKIQSILIVDDDEDVLLAAKMFLKKHIPQITIEQNPNKIPYLVNNHDYDVILLDMNFSEDTTSGVEGFHWLSRILEYNPRAIVIMITAFGDVEMAVKALKKGATDFVLKPWQNEKLLATLSAASKLKESYQEVHRLEKKNKQLSDDLCEESLNEMLGGSMAMQKVRKAILKVAKTDANVLILGENGTGKELVAKALHKESHRNENTFVSVDMGAVSETLFESELFGYKKGAFTDAKDDKPGRFEVAHKGSLFLDEIGNLPYNLQSKLLTVLQNREVTPLGSNKPVKIDIRLICATNMDLTDRVDEQAFRQDLLYRINTVEIHLPPLRERMEDIDLLTEHFVKMYAKKYKKTIKKIHPSTINKLKSHHWPGNIRELQHAIERAIIMIDNEVLQPDDFIFLHTTASKKEVNTLKLGDVEKQAIEQAIKMHNGNVSKAAKELGLTRASLYRRLEKYGI